MIRRFLIVFVAALFSAAVFAPQALAQNRDRAERYPNEPEGFVPWFEHDWQSWPTRPAESMTASDAGAVRLGPGQGSADNVWLVDDLNAPHGQGKSLRMRLPQGQVNGVGHAAFDLFHPRPGAGTSISMADQVKLRSVYRSHWIMIEPDPVTGDFRFGHSHMRKFWWNRFYSAARGGNVSIRAPGGGGSNDPAVRHASYPGPQYWRIPYPPGSASIGRPSPADLELRVGDWHHFEYLWETQGNFSGGPRMPELDGGTGENDSRLRIWVDGKLAFDEVVKHLIQYPLAAERFSMIFLAAPSWHPTWDPQGDESLGGWTDQDSRSTDIYRSIVGSDDANFVQSPLNPSEASYITQVEIEDPERINAEESGLNPQNDGQFRFRPSAHRTATIYQFRKNEAGGQRIDLTVDVLIPAEEGRWEVFATTTHEDLSAEWSEHQLRSPSNYQVTLPTGSYALRFTAKGEDGDERRAMVSAAQFRTTHSARRTQDDFIRFGDIYVSGVIHQED